MTRWFELLRKAVHAGRLDGVTIPAALISYILFGKHGVLFSPGSMLLFLLGAATIYLTYEIAGSTARTSVSNHLDPPGIAEFLLTALATTRAAEAMVGDLNERFSDECQKFGRDRAVRLYWARTLRSLWPLLRRAIGKALRWGAVIAMVRRLF